jgi:hypothetical protein
MAGRSGTEGEESIEPPHPRTGGITLTAMRLLALCAGILVAAFVLYFLGRESPVERRSVPPLSSSAADEPAAAETAPPASSQAESLERDSEGKAEHWQLLPLEAPASAPGGSRFLVRGSVVAARTRWGIAGARLEVLARLDGTESSVKRGTTDSDGRFELLMPEEGPGSWEEELRDVAQERRLSEEDRRLTRMMEEEQTARSEGKTLARKRSREELARAALSRMEELSRAKSSLVLRITSEGYLPKEVALAAGSDAGCDLGEIVLEQGEVFTGRVLGLLETAATDVAVYLVSADDLRRLGGTRTDTNGEYALPLPLPGIYHVHARAEDQGAGVLADIELPPIGDPVLPDLLLRGEGLLTGFVSYIDESPAEAVSVLAVPPDFAGLPLAAIQEERLVYEEMKGGLFGNFATSDRDGSYEIPYLAAGPYLLRFGDDLEYETGAPAIPSTSVRLAYPHNRVRVRMRPDRSRMRAMGYASEAWVAPEIECVELIDGANGERKPLGPPVESPASGDRFFRVEPGHMYEVHALDGGKVVDPRTFVVPGTPCETVFDLRLPDEELPLDERSGAEDVTSTVKPEPASTEAREETPRDVPILLLLEWEETFAAPAEPPPIEALLERVAEGRAPAAVDVEWSASPLPEGVSLPLRIGDCETQPLPAGRYRLRLRMDDAPFFDRELAHGAGEAGSLPFWFVSVPKPQNSAGSAR